MKGLTVQPIYADYHTHTRHSHGRGTVEDNVKTAVSQGLKAIAITDHGPRSLFGVGVSSLSVFGLVKEEIEHCQAQFPQIKILLGVEANIIDIDGSLDLPPESLDQFDLVLAGLHPLVYPASLVFGLGMVGNLVGRHVPYLARKLRQWNTQAVCSALIQNPIDILTHPGLHMNIDTEKVAKTCTQVGTYMEINTSHDHITAEYLRIAFQAGARFVIGSDAHSPDRVGDAAKGLLLAETAGIPASAIQNTRQETLQRTAKRYGSKQTGKGCRLT